MLLGDISGLQYYTSISCKLETVGQEWKTDYKIYLIIILPI